MSKLQKKIAELENGKYVLKLHIDEINAKAPLNLMGIDDDNRLKELIDVCTTKEKLWGIIDEVLSRPLIVEHREVLESFMLKKLLNDGKHLTGVGYTLAGHFIKMEDKLSDLVGKLTTDPTIKDLIELEYSTVDVRINIVDKHLHINDVRVNNNGTINIDVWCSSYHPETLIYKGTKYHIYNDDSTYNELVNLIVRLHGSTDFH